MKKHTSFVEMMANFIKKLAFFDLKEYDQ